MESQKINIKEEIFNELLVYDEEKCIWSRNKSSL